MPETSTTAGPFQHEHAKPSIDHTLTICAISIVAAILSNTLHEGVGHGLAALLTGAKFNNASGLCTVMQPFQIMAITAVVIDSAWQASDP